MFQDSSSRFKFEKAGTHGEEVGKQLPPPPPLVYVISLALITGLGVLSPQPLVFA